MAGNDDIFDGMPESDDFSFGSGRPPAQNLNQAIRYTVGDMGKGVRESIATRKGGLDILRNSLPNSISGDVDSITDMAGAIQDEVMKGITDLKKETSGLAGMLAKLMPKDSKLEGLFKSIQEKLGADTAAREQQNEQQQKEQEIQEGILSALGQLTEKSHIDAMAQQAIQAKSGATTNVLLQNIYAETNLTRHFHYEVSNKYYRKSLELQYHTLFAVRENVEFAKFAFETQTKQLEAIVRNTSLPDVLKTRTQEFYEAEMKGRIRQALLNNFYSRFNPMENFKKNAIRKIRSTFSGFIEGVKGSKEALDALSALDSMEEMGLTKGYMAGEMIGDTIKKYIGNKLKPVVAKMPGFGRASRTLASFTQDPAGMAARLRDRITGDGMISKGLRKILGIAAGLGGASESRSVQFGRYNLDEVRPFDGRAHQALVKVIPGYLARIHAEMAILREHFVSFKGDKDYNDAVHKHRLIFDTHDDMFRTKKQFERNVSDRIYKQVEGNLLRSLGAFHDALGRLGVKVPEKMKKNINVGMCKYFLEYNGRVKSDLFADSTFLSCMPNEGTINYCKEIAPVVWDNFATDTYLQKSLYACAENVKTDIPAYDKLYKELYKSGYADLLVGNNLDSHKKYQPGATLNLNQKRGKTGTAFIAGTRDNAGNIIFDNNNYNAGVLSFLDDVQNVRLMDKVYASVDDKEKAKLIQSMSDTDENVQKMDKYVNTALGYLGIPELNEDNIEKFIKIYGNKARDKFEEYFGLDFTTMGKDAEKIYQFASDYAEAKMKMLDKSLPARERVMWKQKAEKSLKLLKFKTKNAAKYHYANTNFKALRDDAWDVTKAAGSKAWDLTKDAGGFMYENFTTAGMKKDFQHAKAWIQKKWNDSTWVAWLKEQWARIKVMSPEEVGAWFSQKTTEVCIFIVSWCPEPLRETVEKALKRAQGIANSTFNWFVTKYRQAKDGTLKDSLLASWREFKDKSGNILQRIREDGFVDGVFVPYEKEIQDFKDRVKAVFGFHKEYKEGDLITRDEMFTKFGKHTGPDADAMLLPPGAATGVDGKITLPDGTEVRRKEGHDSQYRIEKVGNFINAVGAEASAFQQASRNPLTLVGYASKKIGQVKRMWKNRPRDKEDLEHEYKRMYSAEEINAGLAPRFDAWVETMGYRIKTDLNDHWLVKFIKTTREWDKKIAKGILSTITGIGRGKGKKGLLRHAVELPFKAIFGGSRAIIRSGNKGILGAILKTAPFKLGMPAHLGFKAADATLSGISSLFAKIFKRKKQEGKTDEVAVEEAKEEAEKAGEEVTEEHVQEVLEAQAAEESGIEEQLNEGQEGQEGNTNVSQKGSGGLLNSTRKLEKGLLKGIFKRVTGIGLGKGKKGLIRQAAGAPLAAASAVAQSGSSGVLGALLKTMPAGLGTPFIKVFGLLNALTTKVNKVVDKEIKEREEEDDSSDSKRKGSWMGRLKNRVVGWFKGTGEKKGVMQRAKEFIQENKGKLTVLGILGGLYGIMKATGMDVKDMVKGIKDIVSTVSSVFVGTKDFLSKAFSLIPGVSPEAAGWLGTLATLGAGYYMFKHPIKTLTGGFKAGKWIFDKVTGRDRKKKAAANFAKKRKLVEERRAKQAAKRQADIDNRKKQFREHIDKRNAADPKKNAKPGAPDTKAGAKPGAKPGVKPSVDLKNNAPKGLNPPKTPKGKGLFSAVVHAISVMAAPVVEFGQKAVDWVWGQLKEKITMVVNAAKDTIDAVQKKLDAMGKAWKRFKNRIKNLCKFWDKPKTYAGKIVDRIKTKLGKKVVAKVAAKGVGKFAAYVAGATNPVGWVINAIMSVWDTFYIVKYWLVDKMDLLSSILHQMLGFDFWTFQEPNNEWSIYGIGTWDENGHHPIGELTDSELAELESDDIDENTGELKQSKQEQEAKNNAQAPSVADNTTTTSAGNTGGSSSTTAGSGGGLNVPAPATIAGGNKGGGGSSIAPPRTSDSKTIQKNNAAGGSGGGGGGTTKAPPNTSDSKAIKENNKKREEEKKTKENERRRRRGQLILTPTKLMNPKAKHAKKAQKLLDKGPSEHQKQYYLGSPFIDGKVNESQSFPLNKKWKKGDVLTGIVKKQIDLNKLNPDFAARLANAAQDIFERTGIKMRLRSGFRPPDVQKGFYKYRVKRTDKNGNLVYKGLTENHRTIDYIVGEDAKGRLDLKTTFPGQGYVAPPGTGRHETGTAVDIEVGDYGIGKNNNAYYSWLDEPLKKQGIWRSLIPENKGSSGGTLENWHVQPMKGVKMDGDKYNHLYKDDVGDGFNPTEEGQKEEKREQQTLSKVEQAQADNTKTQTEAATNTADTLSTAADTAAGASTAPTTPASTGGGGGGSTAPASAPAATAAASLPSPSTAGGGYSSPGTTDTMSGSFSGEIHDRTTHSLLSQQLDVQRKMLAELVKVSSVFTGQVPPGGANNQPQAKQIPAPAITLKRQTEFSDLLI